MQLELDRQDFHLLKEIAELGDVSPRVFDQDHVAAIAKADLAPLHPGAEGTFHTAVGGSYAPSSRKVKSRFLCS